MEEKKKKKKLEEEGGVDAMMMDEDEKKRFEEVEKEEKKEKESAVQHAKGNGENRSERSGFTDLAFELSQLDGAILRTREGLLGTVSMLQGDFRVRVGEGG